MSRGARLTSIKQMEIKLFANAYFLAARSLRHFITAWAALEAVWPTEAMLAW